jgi:hypothetical protein
MTTRTAYDVTNNADGSVTFSAPPVVTPPPPPPPAGDFLPIPSGWKAAVQIDFKGLSALPSSVWAYGGAPGGTSGCLWNKSALTFDATGLVITTKWNGADWITGGVGTNLGVVAPFIMRVYEKTDDANLEGLNQINLAWGASPSTWPTNVEVDGLERAVKNGLWQPATARLHYGSSNSTTSPLTEPSAEDFGWHTNEFRVQGTTFSTWVDGAATGSGAIPAAAVSVLETTSHWLGSQVQTYSVGSADKTKTSVRHIASLEILVPA